MNILIVEDEAILAQTLCASLAYEGYQTKWADCTKLAWQHMSEVEPDLIALDVMLPEGEDAGFNFARHLREIGNTTPILFLSARDTTEDRIKGLDIGGDDYMVKPYSLEEFSARVRALLRREAQTKQANFTRGELQIDLRRRQVIWQGTAVSLSEREFALLELFSLNPDRIYSADELLERIFPDANSGNRVVRVYVHYLRQKIAPNIIVTATGGYRLGV